MAPPNRPRLIFASSKRPSPTSKRRRTRSQARIARGWTQKQLADELSVAEQQVQRYEATEYRLASLALICDVAAALGIDITEALMGHALGNRPSTTGHPRRRSTSRTATRPVASK